MKRLAVGLLLLLCACSTGPAPAPRTSLPAPPPLGEPTDFVGKSGRQLQTVLGVPAFTRKESGSEMWRYDTKQCRVFFFLYPAGAGLSVRHVETAPHPKGVAADAACLNLLLGKPASPGS